VTLSDAPAAAWSDTPPTFTGALDADAAVLTDCATTCADVVATLPARPDRDAAQQHRAESALALARAARRDFLTRHVDAVYARLTNDRTRHVRLPDLVDTAAEWFPGLVPTPAQLAAEATRTQAERDGCEIDQGTFCGAVLRSPTAGRHLIDAMLLPTSRALELAADFRATGRVELSTVLLERRGPAAHVTFRNAGCLNAEDNHLAADLETAVDLTLLDDQVRVGVLRGGYVDHPKYRDRRVFSAGINLKELRNGAISFVGFLLGRELGYVNKMLRGLLTAPRAETWSERTVQKPWLGAVDTFAIGGGMQLVLVMDRVVAEDGAYFSLPAAAEGIIPGLANLRLTRVVGARLARQLILGNRRIAATDPESRLVCDEVVPSAGMAEAIDRAVRDLSAPAVVANRGMLTIAEEPVDLYREYLAEFAVTQAGRAYSADVLAKVERHWQGSRARVAGHDD
jgi:thioesterase DpgC